MGIVVRNWRDQEPYVGHINALVWTLFRGKETEDSPETALLHSMNVFVKHGLQGRQHSDHHHHTDIEQMYFVLRGRGQLLIGDDKVDVQEGTAVYMPVNVPHQAFNDGDYWMEHLIVGCPLDEIREGTPAVRDWRDITPVIEEHKAIAWPLLTREGEATTTDGGVLQRMHSVTRYAVQGRQTTDWQVGEDLEMVYFILSGHGAIESEDDQEMLTEGTAAYVPPNTFHRFINQSEGWLEYVAFAVEVTVEEDEEQESMVDEDIDLDVVEDGNDQIDDDEEDEQVVENEDEEQESMVDEDIDLDVVEDGNDQIDDDEEDEQVVENEDEEQESMVDEDINLDVVEDGNDQIDDDEEDEQVVGNEDDIGNDDEEDEQVVENEDEEQESMVDEDIDLDVVEDGNDQIDDDEEDEQVVENEDDIGNEDGDGEPVDGDGEAKIEETDSEPSQDSNRTDEDGEVESYKPNL
jgi:mannose-6-phosphate isomerase-like protein (cupin superfamily)